MLPSKLRLFSPVDSFSRELLLNQKDKGEWAEIAFLAKATSLGFVVCKPYGDNKRYDFIVEAGGRTARVQVKSGWTFWKNSYPVGITPIKSPYRRNQLDAIVAYVVPENAWYIIPAEKVRRNRTVCFYPHDRHRGGTFEKYRDCWQILGDVARPARCGKLPKGKRPRNARQAITFQARQARTAWEVLGAALFGG